MFVGFSQADISQAGLSAVVCTDANLTLAERHRDELLDTAWQQRKQWVFHPEPLATAIARVKTLEQGPILLLDHFDSTGSGGTMDTTTVLAEILRQGLENVAFYAIFDPKAALQAANAGVGTTITLSLGAKIPIAGAKGKQRSSNHHRSYQTDFR